MQSFFWSMKRELGVFLTVGADLESQSLFCAFAASICSVLPLPQWYCFIDSLMAKLGY